MESNLMIISFKLSLENCLRREDVESVYDYYTTKISDNFKVIPL